MHARADMHTQFKLQEPCIHAHAQAHVHTCAASACTARVPHLRSGQLPVHVAAAACVAVRLLLQCFQALLQAGCASQPARTHVCVVCTRVCVCVCVCV